MSSLKSLGLGFVFSARDFASAKMMSLERNFSRLDNRVTGGAERMTSAFKQIGVGLGVFTAGAAAVAGGLALAGAAGRFEQGIAAVGAVSRATSLELGMLRESAIQAGILTQFSPDEAVEGLTSLATAGQTARQSTETLVPVLDLAAGSLGQLGVAQAAEAVVGTLNAYGMAAHQAASTTDQLLRITQLTNFQARDFEIGLSKAAAAGATFGQDLNDVLITMGLLRNRNIDASSSATAFREATRRLGADTRAQQAILKAGVDVFDRQTGSMRSVVDITTDFAKATESMTDKERQRLVTVAYGARGMLAFNAIQKAAFTTMKDGTQVTLQGADAIAALRREMSDSAGTAESFRDKLLDTFQGQKTLLSGTLQTLAVVFGEPFAAVFKPIVSTVVNGLNMLLRMFKALPKPIKVAFAGFVTAAGAVTALVGAVIAAKGSIALLGIGLRAIGMTVSGLMLKLLPVLGIIAAISIATVALRSAYQKNLGGISEFIDTMRAKIALLWNGFSQLFSQGGFSGKVRDELAKAENQGFKGFLIAVFRIAHQLKKAWQGIREGFSEAFLAMAPAFLVLKNALNEFAREIYSVFSNLAQGSNQLNYDSLKGFLRFLGAALVKPIGLIVSLIGLLAQLSTGIIRGFRSMKTVIAPAFDAIVLAIDRVVANWRQLTGAADDSTTRINAVAIDWISIGEIIGKVLGGIVTTIGYVIAAIVEVISAVVWFIGGVRDLFISVGTWIGETIAKVVLFLTVDLPGAFNFVYEKLIGFFNSIGGFFSRIGSWFINLFASIASGIKTFFSPVFGFIDQIRRGIQKVIDTIAGGLRWITEKVPSFLLPESFAMSGKLAAAEQPTVAKGVDTNSSTPTMAMPSSTEAKGRSGDIIKLERSISELADRKTDAGDKEMTFHLQVDGETIARASHKANEEAAGRSFSPIPVY